MQIKTNAFSLVELSIVLVILGLLVGGVLAGQSLVRASELRSITTQQGNITAAYYAFRDKYFAIPGDITNATNFWGTDTGGCASWYQSWTPHTSTCNGNGDGQIEANQFIRSERFRAWQHLANAGMIEGKYNGLPCCNDVSEGYAQTGLNTPAGKLADSRWTIFYQPAKSGDSDFFDGIYGNMMQFDTSTAGVIKPDEQWTIDTKMDDGNPTQGKVRAFKKSSGYGANCTTTDTSAAAYDLSSTNKTCRILVIF